MIQIKKSIFLLAALFFVYGWYFIAHTPQVPLQKQTLGVQSGLRLIEQPNDGEEPIVTALDNAAKTIDVEVYLLSDKHILNSLVDACQRGVVVRLMLEEHPFGGGDINQKTKQELDGSCVQTHWTNPAFPLTHEKIITIDSQIVFILNQNLTTASFTKNREYDIEDVNTADIQEVENIFNADWNHSSFQQTDSSLLVSPLSSRSMLENLIRSSASNLDIEMEVIDDPEIISLLVNKAQTTKVQVILPSLTKVASNKDAASRLTQAGVEVRFLENPYIHAKLIVMDKQKAYVGSVNLTTQSMDQNREVGIMVSEQDVVQLLLQSFQSDWDIASQINRSN